MGRKKVEPKRKTRARNRNRKKNFRRRPVLTVPWYTFLRLAKLLPVPDLMLVVMVLMRDLDSGSLGLACGLPRKGTHLLRKDWFSSVCKGVSSVKKDRPLTTLSKSLAMIYKGDRGKGMTSMCGRAV